MVTPDEYYPVVGFIHALAVALNYVFIVTHTLKTKTAVPCHHNHRITHLILHAYLVYQLIEITVNIAANNQVFRIGKVINHIFHSSTNIAIITLVAKSKYNCIQAIVCMIQYKADQAHFKEVIERGPNVKESLWIGTADIKDLYVGERPFLGVLADLLKKVTTQGTDPSMSVYLE